MAGRKKTNYTGRGSWIQVPVSDDEHKSFVKEAEALGLSNAEYGRLLIFKAKGKVAVPTFSADHFQAENRQDHQRLEALLNRLDAAQRDQLGRILEAAFPVAKGKRAS
jgi:DNA-binding transcriptional MerR regulator